MRILILLIVFVLAGAWLTKPDAADLEAALREEVMSAVGR